MWPDLAIFCHFLNKAFQASLCLVAFFYRKSCRLQQDSKFDCQTRRRTHWPLHRHHGLARQRHFQNLTEFFFFCNLTLNRLFIHSFSHLSMNLLLYYLALLFWTWVLHLVHPYQGYLWHCNSLHPKLHWQNIFAIFMPVLVANWKCDWCQFHWLRGYLDVAIVVILLLS